MPCRSAWKRIPRLQEASGETRWDDRFTSQPGDWTGNVYDFYVRVYNKLKLEELRIDGVLLTGGNSLAPCGGDAPERDDTEERTIRYASAHELPVLGVCRGAQMLAFYYGAKPVPIEGHVRQTHTLDNGRTVNSFHNWGMLDLPSVLQITARSEDGVVEEFHHKSLRQYGLQWHPERYHPFRADDLQWVRKVLQL